MRSPIRIASGQGFWGDWLSAPLLQVTRGPVDYLVMDYLAEVTMSILQKQRQRDPRLGYARDLLTVFRDIAPYLVERNVRLITNGGGVNPMAAAEELVKIAHSLGLRQLRIGVVLGDDLMPRIDKLLAAGYEFRHLETGQPLCEIRDRLLSANAYFGAFPIVEALRQGAQVVVTGRTTDTGITLAPMIYEFGWKENDYDLLSAGVVAGHILECGAQASGGNFLGDWASLDLVEPGFPIVEAYPDGSFIVTKHEGTGGAVTRETVAEQLLYEIADPHEYITPECIADFTTIRLEDLGNNRVRVFGIRGRPPTPFYKVSASYAAGYMAVGTLVYSAPGALQRAQVADAILRERLRRLGLQFEETRTEFVGYNACHGPLAKPIEPNEVMLRIAVRSPDYAAVDRFTRELAPLILTGPPGVTGFSGGRPKPSEVVAYFPTLIPKEVVHHEVRILEV
ncbi:MAG: DUF1446 domain-containing protein [Candidatus Kapabacteria bacterium]|nr:DUF1446 domain-containing protein [Candidatus Kapabacteria bacterium]MDW7996824.1 acyclic terpene utilization AtuA family protein [Bacteroidota bacterium]MDW8225032.1 acyclic terpene utilization AtuA family protein [Bacteroidota bacterium]